MTITIPPELEGQVRARAKAEGLTVEAYIEQLIQGDEWAEFSADPLDHADPDFSETHAAVTEGLEQAERGEGKPAREVFAELRVRHGIPRRS